MTTSGRYADTHGLTSYPNLTNSQKKYGSVGKRGSCPGKAIVTAQRKQTLTIIGTNRQSNLFSSSGKADTL